MKRLKTGRINFLKNGNLINEYNHVLLTRRFQKTPTYHSGILSCLLVLITFTLMLTGCEKPIHNNRETSITDEKSEISITDFLINDSTCHWNYTNLISDSVYLINSQEELLTLVSCEGDIPSMPSIDFNDRTLLFVYGQTQYGIETKTISLEETSTNYIFNLTIQCNDATVIDRYLVAIIVSAKITTNTTILFNKTIKN